MLLTRRSARGSTPRRSRRRRISLRTVGVALCAAPHGALSPTSQATDRAPSSPRSASPDTYVSAWNAIGTQAFTAAALAPAEGHAIFAYAAIAVYDAVMAVQRRYEPFAVDAEHPRGTRPRPRWRPRPTASSPTTCRLRPPILDPAYSRLPGPIPDGPGEDLRHRARRAGRRPHSSPLRAGDGFRAPATYTPPNPPIPGVWIPTAATPPIGTYRGGCPVQPRLARPVPARRPAGARAAGSGRDYREVKEIGRAPARPAPPSRPRGQVLGGAAGAAGARLLPRVVLDHGLDVMRRPG